MSTNEIISITEDSWRVVLSAEEGMHALHLAAICKLSVDRGGLPTSPLACESSIARVRGSAGFVTIVTLRASTAEDPNACVISPETPGLRDQLCAMMDHRSAKLERKFDVMKWTVRALVVVSGCFAISSIGKWIFG